MMKIRTTGIQILQAKNPTTFFIADPSVQRPSPEMRTQKTIRNKNPDLALHHGEEDDDEDEETGKRGRRRGAPFLGEGRRWNPFSAIAFSEFGCDERLNGSGINGVTGLRVNAGKSRTLGDNISCA